jgi:hypothetical protein
MVNSCTYSFHLCCWTLPNSIGSIPPHAAFVLGYMGKPLKSRTAEQLGPFQLNSADFELIEWGMWYLAIHFALTRRELSCSQAYAFVNPSTPWMGSVAYLTIHIVLTDEYSA